MELDSGLVVQRLELFWPLEEGVEVTHGMLPPFLSLCGEEADLEFTFSSEECEDSDSTLPIGVLVGLLL